MKFNNLTYNKVVALGVPALLMALLIAAALSVNNVNDAQAQGPGGGDTGNTNSSSTDPYPNLSTYPDPQPCGPGAGTASMGEPHEITTGHYALFDAYWRAISNGERDIDVTGVGVLHTNLCPPEVTQTTTTETSRGRTKTKTVTTRSVRDGGMDIEEAIMHVLDTHTATTVASNAGAGQISLTEYRKLEGAVGEGDRVWWLRLDDPDTEADETSDLGMGFSTLLLDKDHWDTPMRYRFEVERHPADPTDVPHFFAYEAPNASSTPQEPVWDSSQPGKGVVELDAGEYKALQWVFTKPGTYLMWVHLLGDVKKPGANDGWKAISANETETSEVYQYTIQVGTELDEIEPPIFGVNLSVDENSQGGVKVGDPIPIYNAEADVLYYDLTGAGHSNFDLVASTEEPFTVQVVVADGATLDYENEQRRSYDLSLSVTDRVDHEDNFNSYPDDVMIVRIDLKDMPPGLKIQADRTSLRAGETVNFTSWYEPTLDRVGQTPAYEWAEKLSDDTWDVLSDEDAGPTWSVSIPSGSSVTTKTYRARVKLTNGDSIYPTFVNSANEITITWGD